MSLFIITWLTIGFGFWVQFNWQSPPQGILEWVFDCTIGLTAYMLLAPAFAVLRIIA